MLPASWGASPAFQGEFPNFRGPFPALRGELPRLCGEIPASVIWPFPTPDIPPPTASCGLPALRERVETLSVLCDRPRFAIGRGAGPVRGGIEGVEDTVVANTAWRGRVLAVYLADELLNGLSEWGAGSVLGASPARP